MSQFYERGCICPEIPCPYHPTPNRPFNALAEGVAKDFYEALRPVAEPAPPEKEKQDAKG